MATEPDLSKLSEEDLQAIAAGDMSKVSEVGLRTLAGEPPEEKTTGVGGMPLLPRDPRAQTQFDFGGPKSAALAIPGGAVRIGAGFTGVAGENALSRALSEIEAKIRGAAPSPEVYDIYKYLPEIAPFTAAESAVSKLPIASRFAKNLANIGTQALTGYTITPTGKEPELGEMGERERAALISGGISSLPLVARTAGKVAEKGMDFLVGQVSPLREQLARIAEKLGFKIEPGQVVSDKPVSTPGFMGTKPENQVLANRYASAPTGQSVDSITPDFIESRKRDLGQQYDSIFSGNRFKIVPENIRIFQDIANLEDAISPAHVPAVKKTADSILNNYDTLSRVNPPTGEGGVSTGREDIGFTIDGEALHRLRKKLRTVASTATDGAAAREVNNMIDRLDDLIKNTSPELHQRLVKTNREYRATSTLSDLQNTAISGGDISLEKLGNQLAGDTYHPLYPISHLGTELGIRARWEGPTSGAREYGTNITKQMTPRTAKVVIATIAGYPRSQAARTLQKKIADAAATGGLGNITYTPAELAILNPILRSAPILQSDSGEENKAKGGVVYTPKELALLRRG